MDRVIPMRTILCRNPSYTKCKKMNAFLKTYMNKKLRLYEFVKGFEQTLNTLRNSTANVNATTTKSTTNVPSTEIYSLELHCVNVYTRNIFFRVRKHLRRQGLYSLINEMSGPEITKYFFKKYGLRDKL